ncbi:hypothetical protein ABMA28_003610 [Loxostege sticticalis]|uniref:Uncharacterized protein n=1 Tax=Loxostege sticticalis TaxID=481309 RepID=A0ABD0SZ99_LOXSC
MENQAQASACAKVTRKRKSVTKKNTTPAKKVPKVLPDPPADSFLGVLELIWTTSVYTFTDPTRTRCRFELREGEHHIVKKSRALGTRIGFGSGPDPNTYWNF